MKILDELYFGPFAACERHTPRTTEEIAMNRKIEDEKRYFVQKMSLDDCVRFETLDGLYAQANDFQAVKAFTSGFKLGAMLMSAAFMDGEAAV